MIWNLKDLIESTASTHTEIQSGKWVPARPCNSRYRTMRQKFKEAWVVYTGKADAVIWPGGQ